MSDMSKEEMARFDASMKRISDEATRFIEPIGQAVRRQLIATEEITEDQEIWVTQTTLLPNEDGGYTLTVQVR